MIVTAFFCDITAVSLFFSAFLLLVHNMHYCEFYKIKK
jgi:hypothetical protein